MTDKNGVELKNNDLVILKLTAATKNFLSLTGGTLDKPDNLLKADGQVGQIDAIGSSQVRVKFTNVIGGWLEGKDIIKYVPQ